MTPRCVIPILALALAASCKPASDPEPNRGLAPPPPTPRHDGSLDGEVLESVDAQIRAIELDPLSAAARKQLGLLYVANGAPAEAAEAFLQSTQIDPENAQTWFFRALALEQINELDEAMTAITTAQQLDPDRTSLYWQPGFWLLDAGRAAEALPLFEEAAAIESRSGVTAADGAAHRVGRGRCLLELDRPEEAVPILEELRTIVDHYYASYLLGQAYRRVGRGDEAEVIRATGALDPPSYPDPWMEEVAASGRGLDARLSWIETLQAARRLDEAAVAIAEARQRWPKDIYLLHRLAELHRLRGQSASRIRVLKQAVRIDPDHAASHYNLSIALQQQGELHKALNHAYMATRTNPSLTPAWLQIGRLLILTNRLDRGPREGDLDLVNAALEPLDKAFELGVDEQNEHIMYGHLLMRANRLDDATQILERLLDRPDANPKAWAVLSKVHAARGDHRAALATAIDGLNLFPNQPALLQIVDEYRRASGGGAPSQ